MKMEYFGLTECEPHLDPALALSNILLKSSCTDSFWKTKDALKPDLFFLNLLVSSMKSFI